MMTPEQRAAYEAVQDAMREQYEEALVEIMTLAANEGATEASRVMKLAFHLTEEEHGNLVMRIYDFLQESTTARRRGQ